MDPSNCEAQASSLTGSGDIADCPEVWRKKNLLSLDGGGIRGYWTLLVLEKLMEAIAKEEENTRNSSHPDRKDSFYPEDFPTLFSQRQREGSPIQYSDLSATQRYLPCHYFDFICGTSTGGLIAIMLGRLRMSVDDCLREYEALGHRIFGKPRLISQRNVGFVRWPKYDARTMVDVFKDVTHRRCERSAWSNNVYNAPLFPTIPHTCGVMVTAFRRMKSPSGISPEKFYILRSYDLEKPTSNSHARGRYQYNHGTADRMEIWQIARAATAAPMYFKPLKIHVPNKDPCNKIYFSDGGYGLTNNPTKVGISELKEFMGTDCIGTIASIGTARGRNRYEGNGVIDQITRMINELTDPHTVADELESLELNGYSRFDDDEGIDVDLDEWKPNGWTTRNPGSKTLDKIKNGFNRWAVRHENWEKINKCARELVASRQERTRDKSRWHRFSLAASQFRCQNRGCEFVGDTLSSFDTHWKDTHEGKPNADSFKPARYKCWEYPQHN